MNLLRHAIAGSALAPNPRHAFTVAWTEFDAQTAGIKTSLGGASVSTVSPIGTASGTGTAIDAMPTVVSSAARCIKRHQRLIRIVATLGRGHVVRMLAVHHLPPR